MNIYVVQRGDSLWSISQRFGVSMQSISDINKLTEIPGLVIGQALVIPSNERSYRVVPGDSIFSISRRFNVSVNSIAEANGIQSPFTLQPGMVLRIPAKAKNFGFIEANAFIEPSTEDKDRRTMNDVGIYLTYISPFSYYAKADGTLVPLDDGTIIETSKQYLTAPLMVVANYENGQFSPELGHTILTNSGLQQTLINNIISTMRNKGYYGLIMDFEFLPVDDRENYNNFLRRVVDALHPLNYIVATALAPKTSATQAGALYGAHDYQAQGQIVDFVILMTYEWGWSGGPPMPVAPINSVRAVLDYAVSVIPRKKIMMGMPLYGYDWKLPYDPQGGFAKRVSPQDAYTIAYRHGSVVLYDQKAKSPYFTYYDSSKVNHIVWFEDARSVQAKLIMATEYGLRGVSYWVLGVSFPQNWAVLDNMFNIVKVIR